MNRVKSLVVVSDSAAVDGGAAKVAIETARIMSDAGLHVSFFAGGTVVEPDAMGFNIEVTGDASVSSGKPSMATFARGVWNRNAKNRLDVLLREHDPESTIVHVHSWGSRLSPSIFASLRKRRFATVITAHDYLLGCPNSCRYIFPTQKICNLTPASPACVIKRCDRVSYKAKIFRLIRFVAQTHVLRRLRPTLVYVSSFQRGHTDRFIPFRHQSCVIKNPVEVQSRAREYIGSQGPFLCAARLEKEKGVDVFCDALAISGLEGLVVGDGAEKEYLAERYHSVQFPGWASQEQIYLTLLASRALVFPSRWLEAAPLTPLEGQLVAALPCVVSDACAAREMIEDGVTGLVFRTGDAQDLARCLQKIHDPVVHAQLRANILNRLPLLRERYAASNYHSELMSLYTSLLLETRPSIHEG